MVTYKCDTCYKLFNHKGDFKRHLNRKFPCIEKPPQNLQNQAPKLCKKIVCSKCGKTYMRQDSLRRHVHTSCPGKSLRTNSASISSQFQEEDVYPLAASENEDSYSDIDVEECNSSNSAPNCSDGSGVGACNVGEYRCNFCGKTFTRNNNLNRHLKDRCVQKKISDNQKEEIFKMLISQMEELKKENNNLKEKINNININNGKIENNVITNKNTQNNIVNNYNNIKLIAFGEEDLSYISDEVCKKILNKGFQSVPNLVQFVHFNKNKPEHHNVYISNMRDNYVMIYDGDKWKLSDRSEILDQLLEDKRFYLVEKFEELVESLNHITIRKFKRFLDQQDDDEIANNIKKEIRLILYNNKDLPEKTKKLLCNDIQNLIKK